MPVFKPPRSCCEGEFALCFAVEAAAGSGSQVPTCYMLKRWSGMWYQIAHHYYCCEVRRRTFVAPWTTPRGKVRLAVASARDTIFQGRWGIGKMPIQTQLTTSLRSFADIRRDRDPYYEQSFPDQDDWDATLAALDATTSQGVAEIRRSSTIS